MASQRAQRVVLRAYFYVEAVLHWIDLLEPRAKQA